MKKVISPRSGLAQTWAPRLRTIFCIVLCILILSLFVPISSFAASNTPLYDYNGLEAEVLPSQTGRPYLLIAKNISLDITYYYCSNQPFFLQSYSDGFSLKFNTSTGKANYYTYRLDDTSWSFVGENYNSSFGSSNRYTPIWSNHDLFNYSDTSEILFNASTANPIYTLNTAYYIRSENNINDLYSGESLQFYCQTNEGVQAESVTWSIQNSSEYTGLSISDTGLFSVSADSHSIGSVTVQASDINGTYTYTTFNLTIFEGENPDSGGGEGGEGGDTPTPTPTPDASNQDVINSIDDGFSNLENKLEDTGNNIINGLLDGLLRLFVPTSEELSQKMDDFKAWIDEKIPILAVPVALVQYTYDMFFGVTPELGILTFPEIKWMDNVLIQQTELNLSQYSWLNDLLPIIRTVMTAGCCLAFIHWIVGKVKEVGHS